MAMVQGVKRDVNLPARTRARIEDEQNSQRAYKPHDIRSAIPLVDYTNPAKFPPYVFREYPKMPLLDGSQPIVIDDSGGVLVFYDAEDEADFLDSNPEIADEIQRNLPEKTMVERFATQESELEKLRAKLREAGIDPDEGKVVRKAAATGLGGVVTGESMADRVKAASATTKGKNPLLNKRQNAE